MFQELHPKSYVDELGLLNIVLLGCTAKDWREANPKSALNNDNIRDMPSISELAIGTDMESLRTTLIKNEVSKKIDSKYLLKW